MASSLALLASRRRGIHLPNVNVLHRNRRRPPGPVKVSSCAAAGGGGGGGFAWVSKTNNQVSCATDEDVGAIVNLQTDAFHVPMEGPLSVMDSLMKQQFNAEVLSLMRSKMRAQWPTKFQGRKPEEARYTVVVARNEGGDVVGVCDVCEAKVEQRLAQSLSEKHGTAVDNYVFVSCMAVAPEARRRGVASALLDAASELAGEWRSDGGVGSAAGIIGLDVYQDNMVAIKVYEANGYTRATADPPWSWAYGQRPRICLSKTF
ncbi:hypothetical protein PPROV_000188100 [Pycnococcus provasolii]|uniref:N-acetyltransferase domain-containing protein n=1 Tax=Pycnococcus provasolii TaxID=41880 RepID=A0A830H7D3_9CHLO|nr:hypothetical protein PPROV_000188100 [Pycnococcus provasolii]